MDTPPELRLLIVDFLDSYTYNIPAFLRNASQQSISFEVIEYNKLSHKDVERISRSFDGVVLSPGPGTVDEADDLGDFTPALLKCTEAPPIFGICLGFQAICKAFGGTIRRLPEPHHGIISDLLGTNLQTLGRCATRYHSLEVSLPDHVHSELEILAVARNLDESVSIMEVRHMARPIWGVQYHPESVCSQNCSEVAQDFLIAAAVRNTCGHTIHHGLETPPTTPKINSVSMRASQPQNRKSMLWEEIHLEIDLLDAVQEMKGPIHDYVLLESGAKGDWSIFVSAKTAFRFRYSLQQQNYTFESSRTPDKCTEVRDATISQAWNFLRDFSERQIFSGGPENVPFWGGFIGYFSYELGLAQLGIPPFPSLANAVFEPSGCDDIHLLWATESIVYDKRSKTAYLISLQEDTSWLCSTRSMLHDISRTPPHGPIEVLFNPSVTHTNQEQYLKDITTAQEHIKAGNSYELCLTAPTTVRPHVNDGWSSPDVFSNLRLQNPAEFMSLMRLGSVEFVSASPEEFLSFDASTGVASMKPIKGTLSKTSPEGLPVAYDTAVKELHSTKVIAENLMIVDLVRNDLSKVSDDVTCQNLFHVEELETMYQLVSTVEARVRTPSTTAWDLLQATLPPGSMTGAPKRRSCEILRQLESGPRGLYSGVVGFIDVRGNCRTSVSIRNAAKYPGEGLWRIGAGGAITSMSDPKEEWLEQQLKVRSTLKAFQPNFELLETILWKAGAELVLWDEHMHRLWKALQYFHFYVPSATLNGTGVGTYEGMSVYLKDWTESQMSYCDPSSDYRLSLSINCDGIPQLRSMKLPSTLAAGPVQVYLDHYIAPDITALEPFISHKTSNRAHYIAARERVGAQGRDEVLIFRSTSKIADNADERDAIVTEGTYTNVAVLNKERGVLITPRDGCLPGIERQRLISRGEIVEGEIRRRDLRPGMKVALFNSVRGRFDGVIVGGKG